MTKVKPKKNHPWKEYGRRKFMEWKEDQTVQTPNEEREFFGWDNEDEII